MNDVTQRLLDIAGHLARATRRMLRDRDGVTAVEYGVMAGLIVVVALVAIQNLGGIVFVNLYATIANAVTNATAR